MRMLTKTFRLLTSMAGHCTVVALVALVFMLNFNTAASSNDGKNDKWRSVMFAPKDIHSIPILQSTCDSNITYQYTNIVDRHGPNTFKSRDCLMIADELQWDPHSPYFSWSYVEHHRGLWMRLAYRGTCAFQVRHSTRAGFQVGVLDVIAIINNALSVEQLERSRSTSGVGFVTLGIMAPVHGVVDRCKSITYDVYGAEDWIYDIEWRLIQAGLTEPDHFGPSWEYGAGPGDYGGGY